MLQHGILRSMDAAAATVHESARHSGVVITGASSGIGRALALAFAGNTEDLALIGRDIGRLEDVAREAESLGTRASCFVADFASREAMQQLARDVQRKLDVISVLIHSAGVFLSGSFDAVTPEDFDAVLDVNVRAPYLLTRELLVALGKREGDVVFINSSVVQQRREGLAAYGASKHALMALADSLRQEVNPHGIRVLSVFLGATATSMQERIHADHPEDYHPEGLLQPSDVARAVLASLELPRGAEVTDLYLRPSRRHRAG